MGRNFWLKMVAKLLVIMILPLSMRFEIDEFGSYLYYVSIILNIGADTRWWVFEPPPGGYSTVYLDMVLIVSALLLSIPGIYFDYWLSRQPRTRSIKKQLFAAVVFVPMMIVPVAFLIAPRIMDRGFYAYSYLLASLPAWIIVVLVLLPVFTREGTFIDAARHRQSKKPTTDYQTSSPSRLPGRGTLIASIVGLVALCVPFLARVFSWSGGESQVMFLSTSWSGYLSSWSGFSYFEVIPTPFASIFMISFLITPLLFLFNLLFGHSLLLYLQSRVSIVRTAVYGILGMAIPFALYSVLSVFQGPITNYSSVYIPLPVLQAVGVLIVVFVEPTKQDEHIWDDTDDRMWFDEGDQDAGTATERRPKVTIPLTYLLTSRIRALLNGSSNPTVNTDPQKADWTRDEEIWS
ncbi:MAG: hypothetical protein ACFFC0_07705 [Promethearchaeota archaeon]